jgi:hypothetical protein
MLRSTIHKLFPQLEKGLFLSGPAIGGDPGSFGVWTTMRRPRFYLGSGATMHGPLKNPQTNPQAIWSMEKLVEFIKLELVEGTVKSTLTRTLVKNGWDKKEATLFVKQIAEEMEKDPSYVRTQLDSLQLGIVVLLFVTAYWVTARYATGGESSAILSGILRGALLILVVSVWLFYRIRLKRLGTEPSETASQAALFSPTKGNLQITKLYRSWIQWALDLVSYTWLAALTILFLICIALIAFVVIDGFVFG